MTVPERIQRDKVELGGGAVRLAGVVVDAGSPPRF